MSGIESCYHMLSLLLFVQAWSCREALRTAAASGVHDAFTEKIASLGAGGLHMQNAERDMHRTCRRFLNVDYQLYHVKTYLRRPGTGLDEVEWPILLPHEVFAFLFCIFLISFFLFLFTRGLCFAEEGKSTSLQESVCCREVAGLVAEHHT